MITLDDVSRAEEAVATAEQEERAFRTNPARWSAHESLTRDGRRELNMSNVHYDQGEEYRRRVEVAHRNLAATKRAWLEGA